MFRYVSVHKALGRPRVSKCNLVAEILVLSGKFHYGMLEWDGCESICVLSCHGVAKPRFVF